MKRKSTLSFGDLVLLALDRAGGNCQAATQIINDMLQSGQATFHCPKRARACIRQFAESFN